MVTNTDCQSLREERLVVIIVRSPQCHIDDDDNNCGGVGLGAAMAIAMVVVVGVVVTVNGYQGYNLQSLSITPVGPYCITES